MYLASLRTTFSWTSFRDQRDQDRRSRMLLRVQIRFYGRKGEIYVPLRVLGTFLYGYGIQSFLLCVLGIALSVAVVPIAGYYVASRLYAVLPIVHFDSTSILSLHTMHVSKKVINVTQTLETCQQSLTIY